MKSKDENRGASQANTRFAETSRNPFWQIDRIRHLIQSLRRASLSLNRIWTARCKRGGPFKPSFGLSGGHFQAAGNVFPGADLVFYSIRRREADAENATPHVSPTQRKYLRFIFSFHSPTMVPMRALPFPKCCVVCCKKCGHDVEAGTNGFPATSIFVVCSLCGERRRYLPSEVIHGRPHSVARKRRAISGPGKVAPFCPPGQIAARRPESASLPHWYRAKSNRRSA